MTTADIRNACAIGFTLDFGQGSMAMQAGNADTFIDCLYERSPMQTAAPGSRRAQ